MVSKTSSDLRLLASENDSEAVTSKGTKRKSHTGSESPPKKRRCHSNSAEPTEVPVEDVTAKGTKRKATPETETPSKKLRGGNNHADTNTTKVSGGSEQILISGGPSTSDQPNRDTSLSDRTSRASFEAKYVQLFKLGRGGFGTVYGGKRKSDQLPVAIKHIARADVERKAVISHGRRQMIPKEVIIMQKAAGGPESVGKSAAVSLLDWYDLENEVLLVMERPVPSMDLLSYLNDGGPLDEDTAKNIMKQLVEAAIEIHSAGVFHRDIKSENILIESSSDGPRVRVIDFGCGRTVRKKPYHSFDGTMAYAPPEYFESGKYKACPTTVWQLGALLYELLHAYIQFDTNYFLCHQITISSALSKDCQDLLSICLDGDPDERVSLEQILLHPWFT